MTLAARAPVFLVTGGSGQVGHELVRELSLHGRVVAPSSSDLDLSDRDSIRAAIRRIAPSVVVNAGAYTAVDRAESDVDRCTAINAVAPGILAEEVAALGGVIVHFSTDYVFDGAGGRPFTESDPPGPLSVYGATKLAGEQAVQAVGGGYFILRTSWVYGTRGANFMRTMLRLARERAELRVVSDQIGAPTWSRTIAMTTALMLQSMHRAGEAPGSVAADLAGIYHLAAAGRASWYDFAAAALEMDPRRSEQTCRRIVPISSAEYPAPARRPALSLLDTTKLRERFGLAVPDWREQLSLVLGDLSS